MDTELASLLVTKLDSEKVLKLSDGLMVYERAELMVLTLTAIEWGNDLV
jgi:hypothetical protein